MTLPIEIKPLLAANQGGYQISRSVRLRSSASAYFNRTFTTPTNAAKWTFNRWVKRGAIGARQSLFAAGTSGSSYANIEFKADDTIQFLSENSAVQFQLVTTQVFRDPSAWYNIHIIYDSANATSTDRIQLWINGVRVTAFSTATYPTTTPNNLFNTAIAHQIGVLGYGSVAYFDGYQTELNFIDGQALTPSSFGETNTVTGVWQPKKYAGTYGTNGFYLNFSDNSAATAAAIGKDYSGNGNNWTPNNISVTAGVTYDSMLDVPTQWADGGNGRGNYATLNPLQKVSGYAPDNGNLRSVMNATGAIFATIGVTTGKWYWENIYEVAPNGNMEYGVSLGTVSTSSQPGNVSGSWAYSPFNGSIYSQSGTAIATVATASLNDVIGCALDVDAGTLAIYKNNSLLYTITSISGGALFPVIGGSSSINAQTSINFGQRPFAYTPPTGFKALNTLNLPTPTISNGANYFAATLWTGDGANPRTITNTVNGVSLQPDLVWIKARSNAYDHTLYDSIRGATNYLISNSTAAQASAANTLQAFNSNGFQVGGNNSTNSGSVTYVGWQWKANGTAVTNTAGSISSQVSAGGTQGFSVVTYTGTGANATVGHGLGVAPKMIIFRARSIVENWPTWHTNLTSAAYVLTLNTTNAQASVPQVMNSTAPTSSVFSVGTSTGSNGSGTTYVAYCFAEVAGYSKFGSYTGNGSADGPFVFTGFRPRFVMWKRSDATANWFLMDSSRTPANPVNLELYADQTNAEVTFTDCDFVSNGFKLRTSDSSRNASGGTYIYMAFAENPFKNALAR